MYVYITLSHSHTHSYYHTHTRTTTQSLSILWSLSKSLTQILTHSLKYSLTHSLIPSYHHTNTITLTSLSSYHIISYHDPESTQLNNLITQLNLTTHHWSITHHHPTPPQLLTLTPTHPHPSTPPTVFTGHFPTQSFWPNFTLLFLWKNKRKKGWLVLALVLVV